MSETLYILHKNGADSHYTALRFLAENHNITLKYREFSVLGKLFKAIFKGDIKLFKKQIVNLGFIFQLIFSRDKKVILGIAPYDSKLSGLLKLLKKHKLYYHTSWTYWDKTFYPKRSKNKEKAYSVWKMFLEKKAIHIFSVTQQAKNQLIANYDIPNEKISVVYHSLDMAFSERQNTDKKNNSFVYFGRLRPEKGIKELLAFFAQKPNAFFTIIGSGNEAETVKQYTDNHENITYLGHISDKKRLLAELSKYQFLVLNSKKNGKWEELFGLSVIEAMSQGLIVIASNHSGPKEILDENTGYIFEEGKETEMLNKIIDENLFDEKMQENAIEKSKKYLPQNIAPLWSAILD